MNPLPSFSSRSSYVKWITQMSCWLSLARRANMTLCVFFRVRLSLCICTPLPSQLFTLLFLLISLRLMCWESWMSLLPNCIWMSGWPCVPLGSCASFFLLFWLPTNSFIIILWRKTKKVDWISLTDILDKAVIGPYTTSYKNFKGYFFQVPSKLEFMPIDFTRQRVLKFPFYWNLSPIMFIKKKPIIYMYDSDQKDMVVLHKFLMGLHCKTLVDLTFFKKIRGL